MLDWLARKFGRKYALVDFYGDILLYRYYVLYVEKNVDRSWKAKWLPNLFIHVFPGEAGGRGPDGDYPHSHPWTTWAFVIRGWYDELLNERTVRRAKFGRVLRMSEKDVHRITHVKPGTISLFFHGRRKSEWLNAVQKCANVCSSCMKYNAGQCHNTPGVRPMDPGVELADSSMLARGWRRVKWVPVDENFEFVMIDRRATLRRAGVQTPPTMDLKRAAFKDDLLKRSQK